ncbi:hypothetical protein [Capillimicrobium parvum]|uniref:Uncharacterized protein n=1 Tax=Capillimicrobium parvum TaxID=2884022 RepID=A0A9E7C2W4_9ACTN|nr:hypothetical protein [Capillimicrobium parvum]UGS38941.1 hypothetical protein DSM104329_05373 [Capillimicrobium parvum]
MMPAAAGARAARTTFLLSRSTDGAFPNGPSRDPTVSHDQRIARLIAFESDASDIVADDPNGTTDVFVTRRAGGQPGTPWAMGDTTLASIGMDDAPANGPSTNPSLDGDSHHAPHCVAFISAASNLVPGDTNGQPDAFVRDLNTGTTSRVSVNSDGAQADGPTTEVSLDGSCERVAFTAHATNLVGAGASRVARPAQPQAPVNQVYVRMLSGSGPDAAFTGLTFLASASNSGAAGNGDSTEPAFGRAGKSVAFASLASNLAGRDANGTTDVYQRTFTRMSSRRSGKGQQTLRFRTRLVSATTSGQAGNRQSSRPNSSDDGRYVAFETAATNLLPGDFNGVSDIAEADLGRRTVIHRWVSRSKATSIGNAPSNNPSISGAGEFVLFDSEASNLKESAAVRSDTNNQRDVFLWNRPTGNVSLESRAAPTSALAKGDYLTVASGKPAASSRGNYVAFVSIATAIDLPLISRLGATPDPRYDHVYVRYLGEK